MDRSGASNRDQLRGIAHRTMAERRLLPDSLKASMAGQPAHYLDDDLDGLAHHCPEQTENAAKVEREVQKSAAAVLLSQGLDVGDRVRVELVDTAVERGFIDLR